MTYKISQSTKSSDIEQMLTQYVTQQGGFVDVFRHIAQADDIEIEEPFNPSDYDLYDYYEEHADVYVKDGMSQESYLDKLRIAEDGQLEIHFTSWNGNYDGWLSMYDYHADDLLYLATLLDIDYEEITPIQPVHCITVSIDDFESRYDLSHLSRDDKSRLLQDFKRGFQNNDSVMESFWLLIDYMAEDLGLNKIQE